ncbi:MAG: TonB-dependent siderophore receptor [Paracoccus sp. (in: a-proteobacteria)]|uniref:TonB-dependent siderophore receptor n=1 Tax=Paracoccus sp. TaxID=267 RepID=UPI0026E096A9|nr:TonB-dependent siderophore receptor [Paracoccus sp. (in: a-proteobacteria)]MDO5620904.1 TonB-dependent siderophore receptor [Paracoccus sp. (in: a-proteobacteria)]
MLRALLSTSAILIALPALAQEDTVVLDTVVLTGSSYETEGSGSYTTDLVSVGEKEAIDPRKIPQTTSVVTHKRIEDADYTSLDTAMAKTPGMLSLTNDNGRSSIYSRGFELDYLYYDGLPAPLSSIYGSQPDMSIIDHVEILKGPSGLFIGTGEPAGSVNMRLKQASDVFGGSVSASANSFGRGRVQGDVTGPLNSDGSLRGRAVLAYEDGDGFVNKQENGVASAYGTLAYDIDPDTTATLSISHMKRDIKPFNGLPTYADGSLLDIDRKTTTAADWNDFNSTATDVLAAVEHRLENGGFIKFGTRYARHKADFLYGWAGSAASADDTVNGLAYLGREFDSNSLAFDAFASLPFTLGTVQGNAIIGADYQRVKTDLDTARGRIAGTFDLNDWDVSGVARPAVNYTTGQHDDVTRYGLYTQIRLAPVDRMTIVGGARLSWYESESYNRVTGAANPSQKINGKVTPYIGATYDLTDQITAYAGHTAMFQPQTELDANGNIIDPREGSQTELGLKADFGGINASAALFDLRDKNRAQLVEGQTYYAASEKVRVRGLELEASGEITPEWRVTGGYVYTDTKYLNGSNQGETFSTYTPRHLFKLWGEYDPQQGALERFSFGAGVTAMSSFSSVAQGVEVKAPGYAVIDASVAYQIDDLTEVRLNVNNLLDRDYYSRVGSTSVFNFYGEPRNATLKLTRRF